MDYFQQQYFTLTARIAQTKRSPSAGVARNNAKPQMARGGGGDNDADLTNQVVELNEQVSD